MFIFSIQKKQKNGNIIINQNFKIIKSKFKKQSNEQFDINNQ